MPLGHISFILFEGKPTQCSRGSNQPRHNIGFKCQREVIGKHLVVASSSSLYRDGVDAEELRRVGLAVVLLANIGLERAVVIRLQRIYNFLLFHAIILSTLDVLSAILYDFWD